MPEPTDNEAVVDAVTKAANEVTANETEPKESVEPPVEEPTQDEPDAKESETPDAPAEAPVEAPVKPEDDPVLKAQQDEINKLYAEYQKQLQAAQQPTAAPAEDDPNAQVLKELAEMRKENAALRAEQQRQQIIAKAEAHRSALIAHLSKTVPDWADIAPEIEALKTHPAVNHMTTDEAIAFARGRVQSRKAVTAKPVKAVVAPAKPKVSRSTEKPTGAGRQASRVAHSLRDAAALAFDELET